MATCTDCKRDLLRGEVEACADCLEDRRAVRDALDLSTWTETPVEHRPVPPNVAAAMRAARGEA